MRRLSDPVRAGAHDLGLILHVPAVVAGVTALVAVAWQEWFAVAPFVGLAAGSLLLGQVLLRGGGAGQTRRPWPPLVVVPLAWAVVALLCAVPLWATAVLGGAAAGSADVFRDPWNPVFEAMSGITATGLTMVGAESNLPHTLQFWRALLEWTGAAGLVTAMLLVPLAAEDRADLFGAEARNEELPGRGARATAVIAWRLYAVLTAATVAAFLATGVRPWEALNHALTANGTGGFSITDDSFASYGTATKVVGMVALVVGAVDFVALYLLIVERDLRRVWRRTELRALLGVLVVGAPLLVALTALGPASPAMLDTVFLWVAAVATGGFTTVGEVALVPAAMLLLIFAMVLGASSGSTSGGFKLRRAVWLGKAVAGQFRKAWSREGDYHFDGERVSPADARDRLMEVSNLVAIYVAALLLGSLALLVLLPGRADLSDALFEATSALSNVGLTSGVTDASLPAAAKAVLIVLMWVGRLEVFAVLVMLQAPLRKRAREESRPR